MNCTICNEPMAPVIYGYPSMDMIEKAKRDEIVLGGIPSPNVFRPSHYCYACQEQYPMPQDPYDTHNYKPFDL